MLLSSVTLFKQGKAREAHCGLRVRLHLINPKTLPLYDKIRQLCVLTDGTVQRMMHRGYRLCVLLDPDVVKSEIFYI